MNLLAYLEGYLVRVVHYSVYNLWPGPIMGKVVSHTVNDYQLSLRYFDHHDIDGAWRIFTGASWGPFGLMDSIGLDAVHDIEMVYYQDSKNLDDRPPSASKDMIQKGKPGVKTDEGFYTYPNTEYLNPDFLKP